MTEDDTPRVRIHDPGPPLDIVESSGSAVAVIWPGMGARLRSMHRISLGAAGRTVELRHPSEAVYYMIAGDGTVRDHDETHALKPGSMFLVEAETSYVIEGGAGGAELVGGPCPPDQALYERLSSHDGVGKA
jgi:mannose-6-phosphate isomerase-like protein (cupin superfamily)